MTLRSQARDQLRDYMSRTGLSLGQIAGRMGYMRQTLLQLCSSSGYGDSDGEKAGKLILEYLAANPPELPKLPGKLYGTENVEILDGLIDLAKRGAWSLVYGPPGTQKSFVFEYRLAEDAHRLEERSVAYIYSSPMMGMLPLVKEIARGVGASAYGSRGDVTNNILYCLRRRKKPLALIIDEAHHLDGRIDSLELLREIGDRGKIGMILAGHDNLEEIFQQKRAGPLEQWFSRIDYHRRLPGLSEREVRRIAQEELGGIPEKSVGELLRASKTKDYRTGALYLSMRRLMKVLIQAKNSRKITARVISQEAIEEAVRGLN